MNKHMIVDSNTRFPSNFDDLADYQKQCNKFPTALHFRQGQAIDGLCVQYKDCKLPSHGSAGGGHPIHFSLPDGVYITKIKGGTKRYWNGIFIISLTFVLNNGREFGLPDNIPKHDISIPFEYKVPDGMAVTCFYGTFSHPYEVDKPFEPLKNVSLLSSLGVYYDEIK